MADGWPNLKDPIAMSLYAALKRVYRWERSSFPDNQEAVYEQARKALEDADAV